MNYNHTGARRGKPTKRVLDPSVGTTSSSPVPPMPQSNYMYNQQVPMNNGMPPEYGFNLPGQEPSASPVPPSFGFNQQQTPTIPYAPASPQNESFRGPGQFTTQLLAEPLVANMAMQYGNALASSGKQQIERFLPINSLRYYFAVDTDYVVMKLLLLFFPFTHKDWSIKYEQENPLQPRYEKKCTRHVHSHNGFSYLRCGGWLCTRHARKIHARAIGHNC